MIGNEIKNKTTHYMEQLRELWNLVTHRNLKESQPKISEIEHYRHIDDPYVSTAFYILLFEYHTAMRNKEEALKLKGEIQQRSTYTYDETKVWYYNAVGYFEYVYGDINKCLSNLEEAVTALVKLGKNPHSQLEFLLGLAHTRVMLTSRSIYHTEQALKLYNEEFNFDRVIDCKLLLGINYSKMGFYDKAETHFIDLIDHLTSSDPQMILGKVYHNLGYLLMEKGNLENAIILLEKALTIKPNQEETFNTMYLLAFSYKRHGNKNNALNLCQKGLDLTQSVDLHFYYKFLILLHSLEDTFDQAEFFEKLKNVIIPYFLEQDPVVASECFILLGEISSAKNQFEQASSYYKQALDLTYNNKRKELLR